MLREMQREVNAGHPCERRLDIDDSTNNHPPQLHAVTDLDCCFVAILSWREPAGPRIMRKLWSNLKPNRASNFCEQSAGVRERTAFPRGKRTEDISRERGIEPQLRAAAQRAYRDQEDTRDPTVAPQRVLELQRKVESQGEQVRRVQEAEDAGIILVIAPTNCLGILEIMAFGRNA